MPTLEATVAAAVLADNEAWLGVGWPAEPVAPNFDDVQGDAFVVMREDLRDLHYAPYVPIRCATLDFDPVRVAVQMLGLAQPERDVIGPNVAFYARHLEQLARARYALIVFTHERKLPASAGAAGYEGGSVSGTALLYELDGRALRGGFEYHAGNSWEVKGSDRTITDKLHVDLESRFSWAVINGIAARFPDGRAPATLGYV